MKQDGRYSKKRDQTLAGIPEASVAFVYQMEEALEVYKRPYDPVHTVICLDEARQQLMNEIRQSFTDKNETQ